MSLVRFCQQSRYAPGRQLAALLHFDPVLHPLPTPLRALPTKAWQMLKQQGLRGTAREVRQYIRWKIGIC
jgi:hypothetical protein